MKRNHILVSLALGAAATLVGCSSNSPTAPKQPTPTSYGISVTATPSVAGINESILLVAQLAGSVPDGTSVTFTTTLGVFENGKQEETRTTTGGRATATLVSLSGGDGVVTARVPNNSATAAVHFRGGSVAQLAITSVQPNRATAAGGTQVVIHGQGFLQPLDVNFIVGGVSYPATIVSVATDGSSITVLTPQIPGSSSVDRLADVQVILRGVTSGGQPVSVTGVGLFTFSADTGIPLLYSVVPSTGSAAGGEIITLTGKFFNEPFEVDFNFTDPAGGAKSLPGRTVDVQHGADGTDVAHIQVPRASTTTVSQPIFVDLVLKNGVGTANPQSSTYPKAFVYVPDVTSPPVIYYISPTSGSVQGHETVMIFGANFVQPLTVQIGTVNEIVQSVSSDGTTITIMTQPLAGTPPTVAQNVTVTTPFGVATLASAFTYLEGQTPQLYALSPNNGPIEGGTRVTITGIGFQYPVQVLFGTQQAQIVSTNYDQVVCVSPSITASGPPSTPQTVQVSVTNLSSGKVSQNTLPFQYGQAMFISGISPMQGPADTPTTVTITGQGFVAPVSVIWNATQQWPVLSVAGTQIVTKSVPLSGACSSSNGTLKVTNLDSGLSATSTDSFTYQAVTPLITSVKIGSGNTVQQYQPVGVVTCTAPWSSHTVTINGSGFSTAGVQVKFGNVGPVLVTPTNAATITLTLPDLTELAASFPSIDCTLVGGATGTQKLPKPVDVTVTNTTSGCSNTLDGAIIILPCDTACRLVSAPAPTVTSLDVTSGPEAGGTAVRVFGTGFVSGANVRFGGVLASSVSWPSPTEIHCTTPAGAAGPVNVVVINPDTQFGTLPNGFTYDPSLTVTLAGNISTNTVSSSGGYITACASSCNAVVPYNTVVTLTATASGTWSGDCSGTGTSPVAPVLMNADRGCTVTFP